MKKSILLTIVALIGVALFAVSASALVVTSTPTWDIDCDTATAQTLGDITVTESFPGEFAIFDDAGIITIIYTLNDTEVFTINHGLTTITKTNTDPASLFDPTGLTIAGTTTTIIGAAGIGTGFDDITGAGASAEGFVISGATVVTGTSAVGMKDINGDPNPDYIASDAEDGNCLVTAAITVAYGGAVVTPLNAVITKTVVVAASADEPDLCHTTIKFPYVLNSVDYNNNYMTALIITSNSDTACPSVEFDPNVLPPPAVVRNSVDFYAWDEAGDYKGHRGGYELSPSGQVVIIVGDGDDTANNPTNSLNVTPQNLQLPGWENTWWQFPKAAEGTAATAWDPWTNKAADPADASANNADPTVLGDDFGRGQVIALVDQNYAEGYQILFKIGNNGVEQMTATLGLLDSTNYIGTTDNNDKAGAYIRSVLMVGNFNRGAAGLNSINIFAEDIAGSIAGEGIEYPAWADPVFAGGHATGAGITYNIGIVGVTEGTIEYTTNDAGTPLDASDDTTIDIFKGTRVYGIAGLTDGNLH